MVALSRAPEELGIASTMECPSAAVSPAEAANAVGHVPRTRAGSALVGLGSATRIVVTLVVFRPQNIGSVAILFLWMAGQASLKIVLLIVVLGAVLLALSLGTVRILQLRRLVNRGRRD